MKIRGIHKMMYRWIAMILCCTLCLGSIPLHVLAKETDTGIEAPQSDTAALAEEGAAADTTDVDAEPVNEGDDPDGDSSDSSDSEEADKDISDDDGTDTADDGEEPDDSPDADASESISDNDVDAVSENDLISVSENDLDDSAAKRQALIKSAEEAFNQLIIEKNLMALLYHTDSYTVRSGADQDSAAAATIEIGQTLYIKGVKITENDVWYLVQFWQGGTEGMGYVQSYYLAYSDEDWIAWEERYLRPILEDENVEYGITAYGMAVYDMLPYAVDTSDINAFPGSYQGALRSLKSEHPNWTFVPMKTGLDFNTSVSKEMGVKSLIQKTTNNSSKGWVGEACPSEGGWYYATQPAVAYHMDPRNFLTETSIFQFEQLTFNASYHTVEAVQNFLNGTFMKGKLADDPAGRTYALAFYEIGSNRKLSPIHLASRVYQEQGQGNSGLISGTYPGYEGYYNFFNVKAAGASTAEKIVNGLKHAKEKGWDTRYKSLEGGAATIGNNYILKYQDTIYLEKFNVDKNSPYGVYEHQYMQNIQAPSSESSSTRKMYANAGSLNSAFVFKIPVYNNMPEEQYYPALSLDQTSITLDRSKAADCENGRQLKFYVDNVEVNPSEAEWDSSDKTVVTVEDGLVKIAGGAQYGKAGEAVVTASYRIPGTSESVEVSCKAKVIISLQTITLIKEEISLRRPDTVVQDTTGLSEAEKAENTDTAFLQVSFDPADTTADRKITWTSKNTKIATVRADPEDDSKAVVSAVGSGTVEITAKAVGAGGQTASCTIYVSAPICGITLTNRNAQETDPADRTSLLAGQSINLSAEYYPKDTTSDTSVVWTSSNPAVATVMDGKVTAVGSDPKQNTAVITAKVAGCEAGYTAQHTVIVENCTVTFMKPASGGMTMLGDPERVLYGSTVSAETLQEREQMLLAGGYDPAKSIFIGWYTGPDGTGRRFDETTIIYSKDTTLYPYYEEQGKGFYVLPVGDQTYTGSAVKPVVSVYDSVTYENGDRELIELVPNKDYTVSYKNNKNVSQEGKLPTITVKGKGNYTGTQQITFNIVPKALTDTDISADHITVAYSGKVIKSVPTVYRGGKKLTRNKDYTVTYPLTDTGAYKAAGTYPVVIKGIGGYSGTITIRQTITQSVMMSKVSIAKIPNQPYLNGAVNKEQGTGIEPELKVTYKGQPLVKSEDGGLTGDYTVAYTDNMAIGTATAMITAVEGSGYAGSKSIKYKITGTSIAKAMAEGIADREYTGNADEARQPDGAYTLTLNGQTLTESKDNGLTGDYVTVYANTAKAGTASVTFKGINEYTGQLKKTYRITGYDIGSDENGAGAYAITMKYYTQDEPYTQAEPERLKPVTTLSEIMAPYVKGGTKPVVLLYFKGNELTAGKDYTIKYANNNAVTPTDPAERDEKKLPRITITGKGNFRGTITGTYTITDGRMNQTDGKITMSAKDVVYKGKKNTYKSTVTLKDCNGSKLAAGRDYDRNLVYTYAQDVSLRDAEGNEINRKAGELVSAEDIPPANTLLRVTAQGIGAYAGLKSDGDNGSTGQNETAAGGGNDAPQISATYRIVAADIAKARVSAKAQVYQNGRAITLTSEDLEITMGGIPDELVYGVDYVIDEATYTNHTNKGKAAVTIRGIGNYGGEKKITYTIGSKTLVWWKNLIR